MSALGELKCLKYFAACLLRSEFITLGTLVHFRHFSIKCTYVHVSVGIILNFYHFGLKFEK